jgi:glycosyltransferase involved in cell wall biosynthesis
MGMTFNERIGVVVIGRNEGERLETALSSAKATGLSAVYVDSGSSDGSVAAAERLADRIVELDPSRPFSAARARNEGLDALCAMSSRFEFVLFLDGDCVLDAGFPIAAMAAMDAEPMLAIVTGHLHERGANSSRYTRLSALEWSSPPGEILDFSTLGGIMLARVADVRSVGGFNPEMIAGEDSELGVRMALAGRKVRKIDAAMAVHSAGIVRFGQWWRRAVRAGHALAHRRALHGATELRDCAREYRSTMAWGIVLPLAILVLLIPSKGFSAILIGGYALLAWRINRHYRHKGVSRSDAASGAFFGLCSKFANGVGIVRYKLDRIRKNYRIIEYK